MPATAWMCGGGRFCLGGAMARAARRLKAKRALRLHSSVRPLAWRGRGAGVREAAGMQCCSVLDGYDRCGFCLSLAVTSRSGRIDTKM